MSARLVRSTRDEEDPELELLGPEELDEVVSGRSDDAPHRARRASTIFGAVALVGFVAFVAARLHRGRRGGSSVHADSFGAGAAIMFAADGAEVNAGAGQVSMNAQRANSSAHQVGTSAPQSIAEQPDDLVALAAKAGKENKRWHPSVVTTTKRVSTTTSIPAGEHIDGDPLTPHENMNDGNVCDDTEEMYDGLCYRKCSILTDNRFPFRNTAFSCCKSRHCPISDMLDMKAASFVPCKGYDVSSESNATACPHSAGYCLDDEEQFLNQCYKKCSILTNNEAPHRVAALTCCKTRGLLCLNPLMDKTDAKFNRGGGDGYPNPHPPSTALTEAL